jgi:ferredoxin
VDPRLCEGHGICTEMSPNLFELIDDDLATVTDQRPGEQHWAALRAAAACLRQAITVTSAHTDALPEEGDLWTNSGR